MKDPKVFLKVPSAAIYTSLKGGARAEKKRDFLVKFFQKVPKNAFLDCFSKFCLRRRNVGQNRDFLVMLAAWESSENQFGRHLKKGRQNFKKFLKIRPLPRENPRSAPVVELFFFN